MYIFYIINSKLLFWNIHIHNTYMYMYGSKTKKVTKNRADIEFDMFPIKILIYQAM